MKSSPNQSSSTTSATDTSSLRWASRLSSLPSQPGVYWFIDDDGDVLYVGKAKDLKKRVTSYKRFQRMAERTKRLVFHATKVKHQVLASELEALLIEAELIRTHQPQYNIALKDDKSPLYLSITKDKFPRIKMLRKKELSFIEKKGTILGPFPSAHKLKEVLRITRRIFPWCSNPSVNNKKNNLRPCFYYHLDLCPGVCTGDISSQNYNQLITKLVSFLRGKTSQVLKQLNTDIKEHSKSQEYEQAARLRDSLQLIKEVTKPGYKLKPDLTLPMLAASSTKESILHLQRILSEHGLVPKKYSLKRIEGYDVSNTQGKQASVAMVVFTDGQPDKSQYRLFNIRTLDTPNDYHMLKEAISRRAFHTEWGRPNLLVIDGGKGQLRSARLAWPKQRIISLAKNPDRVIIPLSNTQPTDKPKYHILKLPSNNPALKLLQQIRNESHRFSKKQHTKRRLKELFQ